MTALSADDECNKKKEIPMMSETLMQALKLFNPNNGQKTTLADFLISYTLHDSEWIGIWSEAFDQNATAVFKWDTSFCSDRVPYYGPWVGKYPILFIHFPKVYLLYFKRGMDEYCTETITAIKSSPITGEICGEWLDAFTIDQGLQSLYDSLTLERATYHTVLEGVQDDETHIIHGDEVIIWCVDPDGNILTIPGI